MLFSRGINRSENNLRLVIEENGDCHHGTDVRSSVSGSEEGNAHLDSGIRAGQVNYCMTVKFKQAAVLLTGVLPAAPALKRMMLSSLEQKLRTPDWL